MGSVSANGSSGNPRRSSYDLTRDPLEGTATHRYLIRYPLSRDPLEGLLTFSHERSIRLYHATTSEDAARIQTEGFQDSVGRFGFLTAEPLRGVWFADEPLALNDGAWAADGWIELELVTTNDELLDWAVIEEGRRFIEFLIPAEVINQRLKRRRARLTWHSSRPRSRPSVYLRRWLYARLLQGQPGAGESTS